MAKLISKTSTAASAGALPKTKSCTATSTNLCGHCDQPPFVLDFARQWQQAEKIVYSRTLVEPRSARTRIEREFDPSALRRLKADAENDITVDGPELTAQATRAGLVDEFQMIVCPWIVGSGKRFFPDGVRLDLKLVGERRFRKGVVVLRYAVRN